MGLGRMSSDIQIIETVIVKDKEGFSKTIDVVRAAVRAYVEDRRGTEAWRNRAAFSNASVLFRFRFIPALTVTSSMWILCDGRRYNITDIDDVRGRHMYYEALAERTEPIGGVDIGESDSQNA